jgi:hypothetical protein
MRRLFRIDWPLFAAVVAVVAVASVIITSLRAPSNGCLFDDGVAYCQMGLGKLTTLPWSRRVAVPALVTVLPHTWSVVLRYQLVALVSSLGATIGTFFLTIRLVRDRTTPCVAYCAAVAAGSLVALAPHLFRMALLAPVLVDQAAIFLGVVWCLLVTCETGSLKWASPLVALLLVPTREASILPLLLAAGVLWWMRQRALAAATAVATVLGTVFTLTRPTSTVGPFGHFSSAIQVLHDGRVTLMHPDRALWSVFFGAGFVTFLALLLFARRRQLRGPVGIVLAVACAHLVQAPLGGTDVPRYAAEAVPFAAVLAMVAAIEVGTPRAFWGLTALTAATLLLWQPFRVPSPGAGPYLAMYKPGGDAVVIALGGILLIAATLIWVLRDMGVAPRIGGGGGSAARLFLGQRSSDA